MVWAGGCLGSQPPRPFCLFHFHFLLPLTVLLFTFSFSAHSIKAKDLRFSSSNFPANSIFGANTQSDVTNIISGSLSCAIGITGDGKPVYCETGGDCTDGNPSTLCICADSSSGVLPTFKSHLCVDPQLYHPKIQIISDPRLQTCPAPYIVDVDISNSGDANKYIRAMSYRYVAQWIKNYTPKCWAGLDDSECPGGVAISNQRMLLVDIPLAPTSPVEQSHCCSKATGGPSNPVFGAFNATATTENSKTHITSIDTLNTTTCNVQLNTKLSCGGTDFCSYCPTTTKYTTWKSSEFCMCESAGTPCGTSCRICSGSPPYQCVPPNTSCSGGQIWDFGSCSCVCPSGLVWDGSSCVCPAGLVWNGSSCVSPICTPSCGDCEDCVLGVCQSDCQFGEVCCGGNCYDDTCTVSGETWDSSTCSCQPPNPCQGVVCGGTCSECKVGTGTCGPITDCCTSNIECLGSCNNCDLGTNTCTGGCSGSQVCCSGTCQANCGCPQTPKPSCSNCWETNNYSWQSYPTCSWTGSCTGSQPTCTPPQTWDSGTCNCVTVNPCNSCSPSQDCCNDTCYNQCPSGQTRNSSCICVPDPCPPCGTCETCVSGSCVNKSNGIACGNCGDCQSGICSNEGPQPCSGCTAWNSNTCSCKSTCPASQICCSGSCKNPVTSCPGPDSECKQPSSDRCDCVNAGGSCGTCGTCSGGSCNEPNTCTCPPTPEPSCPDCWQFRSWNNNTCSWGSCSGSQPSCGACGFNTSTCSCNSPPSNCACGVNSATCSCNSPPSCGACGNRNTCSCNSPPTNCACGVNSATCSCNSPPSCGACGNRNTCSCNSPPTNCACGVNSATCSCNSPPSCGACGNRNTCSCNSPPTNCACGVNSATCSCNSPPSCGACGNKNACECNSPPSNCACGVSNCQCISPPSCGACGNKNACSCNSPPSCGACGNKNACECNSPPSNCACGVSNCQCISPPSCGACGNRDACSCNSQPPQPPCPPPNVNTYSFDTDTCSWDGGCSPPPPIPPPELCHCHRRRSPFAAATGRHLGLAIVILIDNDMGLLP